MNDKNHFAYECHICDETWPTEEDRTVHENEEHCYCADCNRFFRSYNGIKMVSVDSLSSLIGLSVTRRSISSRASIEANKWPVPFVKDALPPQPESPITLSRARAPTRPTLTETGSTKSYDPKTLMVPSQKSCLHGTAPTSTRPLVSPGMDTPMNAISATESSTGYKASIST